MATKISNCLNIITNGDLEMLLRVYDQMLYSTELLNLSERFACLITLTKILSLVSKRIEYLNNKDFVLLLIRRLQREISILPFEEKNILIASIRRSNTVIQHSFI